MIVRNKKAIEREKKLLNDLLVRTGYTKPKTKFRYEFPDLSVRKTASTTNKVGNGLAKKYGTYTGDELLGIEHYINPMQYQYVKIAMMLLIKQT